MNKTCGNCNFNIRSRPNKGIIEACCARDKQWRNQKTPDCGKWAEYIPHLSSKDRLSIAESEHKETHDLEANRLASEANDIAREAKDSALEANRIASDALIESRSSAKSARKQARWAMWAAIIATIAIIIAAMAYIKTP
jgi:hypothetical protein